MESFAAGLPVLDRPSNVTAEDPDRELVARFQAGERAAFDQLVRRHQKAMWRLIRRYVRSDADAADVTQLAFVRAFRGLAAFRGDVGARRP